MQKKCHLNMMKGLFLLSSFAIIVTNPVFADNIDMNNLYRIDQKEAKKQCSDCQQIINNEGNNVGTFRQFSNGDVYVEEKNSDGNTVFKTIPTNNSSNKINNSHLKSKMFLMNIF